MVEYLQFDPIMGRIVAQAIPFGNELGLVHEFFLLPGRYCLAKNKSILPRRRDLFDPFQDNFDAFGLTVDRTYVRAHRHTWANKDWVFNDAVPLS